MHQIPQFGGRGYSMPFNMTERSYVGGSGYPFRKSPSVNRSYFRPPYEPVIKESIPPPPTQPIPAAEKSNSSSTVSSGKISDNKEPLPPLDDVDVDTKGPHSLDSDFFTRMRERIYTKERDASNISNVSVLPPPPMESRDISSSREVKDKESNEGGRLLSVFAGGHAGKWEYYLQGYRKQGGQARLLHLNHLLRLDDPYPKQEHPIILSPYSYVDAQVQVNYWPVPVKGNSGAMAGSHAFSFQGFPQYTDDESNFKVVSDQIQDGKKDDTYTLYNNPVEITIVVKRNTGDVLGIGDSNLIYLEWHAKHNRELLCHAGTMFWSAQVHLTFHHF